jgi:hypothetical protein
MTPRIVPVIAVAAFALSACQTPASDPFAGVGRPFNARATQPFACEAPTGPVAYTGFFWGRKEVDMGMMRYWTTNKRLCFSSRQDCENWLYNMQSEYKSFVWRSECRAGLVPL